MGCGEGLLTGDLGYDCENGSIGGLETNVVIINRKDIDQSSIAYDGANKMILTGFSLLSGKTGFALQGIKQTNSTAFELVKKETSADKKKHIFSGIILTLSAANKLQLQLMSEGGNYVLAVEKKWKGASDVDAFDLLGIDSGLELNVSTYNSNENDGTATIELSSVDDFEEPKFPVTLLLADYASTKAVFDNKFIEA